MLKYFITDGRIDENGDRWVTVSTISAHPEAIVFYPYAKDEIPESELIAAFCTVHQLYVATLQDDGRLDPCKRLHFKEAYRSGAIVDDDYEQLFS